MIGFFYRNTKARSTHFSFHPDRSRVLLPVRGLPGAVGELPSHQLLVAQQCKLGSHQEASIEVRKATHFKQRGHRRQGWVLLLCSQLGVEFKNIRGTQTAKKKKKREWREVRGLEEENRNCKRSYFKSMLMSSKMTTDSMWLPWTLAFSRRQ